MPFSPTAGPHLLLSHTHTLSKHGIKLAFVLIGCTHTKIFPSKSDFVLNYYFFFFQSFLLLSMFLDSLEARLYVCEWCLFWRADGGGGNKIAGTHEKGLSVCVRGFKGGKFKSKQVCETVSRQPHFFLNLIIFPI